MQQTVGYSAVLRLYIYLLLTSPLWLWLATRRFWYPIVPATLLWALAGHYGWVASDSLTGIRLNLTIIPWNLVFVLGIAMGAAFRQGVSLKRSKVIDTLAFGYLILVPIVMAIGVENSRELGVWLSERNNHFWFGASKTLQSPLRLLSLICLVYVFVAHRDAPIIRLFYRIDIDHFLCRLGRRSLDVFVVGALLAIINEWSLWALLTIQSPALRTISCFMCEVTFIVAGVRIMLLVADRPHSFFAARSKPRTSHALANGDPACQGVANDNCLPNRGGSGHQPDGSQLRTT